MRFLVRGLGLPLVLNRRLNAYIFGIKNHLQESHMGKNIGYIRVSTDKQNLQLQEDSLKNANCYKIFSDVASGVKVDRPGLKECLDYIREGDTLVVWKSDRLGRQQLTC